MLRPSSGVAAIAAALAVAASGPALSQPSAAPVPGPEVQATLDTYYSCARESARRLEPSQASAEAIARSTRVFCVRESNAALEVLLRFNPAAAGASLDRAVAWGDTLATAEVVVMRLCRLAKDCRSF